MVCTFDRLPPGAKRGLSLAKRCAATSNAYSRPVLRIIAPIANVLPPAPAQKISDHPPRFAPKWVSNWLPHPAPSIATRGEHIQFLQRRFFSKRKPNGAISQGSASMPACSNACTTLAFARLDRVHAHIQRRGLIQGEVSCKVCSLRGDQRLNHSSGIAAHRCRQAIHHAFNTSCNQTNSSSVMAACKLGKSTTFCALSKT